MVEDIRFYAKKLNFEVLGYCIMPDHLHLIVWWDVDKYSKLTISTIMHRVKGRSAKRISDYLLMGSRGFHASANIKPTKWRGIKAPPTQQGISTRDAIKIWQSSFYDFNIYSEKKLSQKLNYLFYNPVRAGLVKKLEDWPWSSIK